MANTFLRKTKGKRGFVKKPFAQAVGAFLPEVTRPVFENFGYQRAALLADWETIIGEPLCRFTAPEQIKWKSAKMATSDLELAAGPPPATLVIRVEGPAALEVQHQAPQIIEKINRYFGYKVIGDVRLLQAPLERAPKTAEIPRHDLNQPCRGEPNFGPEEDRLNHALLRLWRGIKKRQGE